MEQKREGLAQPIDGKRLAEKLRAEIAAGVAALKAEKGVVPGLAVFLVGVYEPRAGNVFAVDGALYAKYFYSDDLYRYIDDSGLNNTSFINQRLTVFILVNIEDLTFPIHCFLATGNDTSGALVDSLDYKIDLTAQAPEHPPRLKLHKFRIRQSGIVGCWVVQHHFAQRDDDAKPVVVYYGQRQSGFGLLNGIQRAGQYTPGTIGTLDFMPKRRFPFRIADDFISGALL